MSDSVVSLWAKFVRVYDCKPAMSSLVSIFQPAWFYEGLPTLSDIVLLSSSIEACLSCINISAFLLLLGGNKHCEVNVEVYRVWEGLAGNLLSPVGHL